MPVKRAIHLNCGGTLLLHPGGKKTYIPSQMYKQTRENYLNPKPSKGKPDTVGNCIKLLDAIMRYNVEKRKLNPRRTGTTGWGFNNIASK